MRSINKGLDEKLQRRETGLLWLNSLSAIKRRRGRRSWRKVLLCPDRFGSTTNDLASLLCEVRDHRAGHWELYEMVESRLVQCRSSRHVGMCWNMVIAVVCRGSPVELSFAVISREERFEERKAVQVYYVR